MQILGAVFVEKVIVQPLTDYIWLGNGTYQEDRLFTITKVFRALSEGMRILDSYYKGLQFADEGVIDRSFPYPRCYPAGSNQHGSTDFHYVSQLVEGNPHRAIFKGRMADSKQEIVVKFVEKYNVSAHRLLASHGLAPKLLHPLDGDPLKIGRLQMIVMEFVRGQNAYYVQLSNDMLNEVERAINILHDGGWVFGDLRTPNIMLRNRKPLLIDFDWCAKDNVGTYPRSLNKEIQWHKDVERGGIMKKEHDIFMLKQLHQGFSLS
ncbi:hypothetical protein FRC03_005644 [Tulasnella sp. 419]|nr:hypothetical protein FRC03_005644 [Tulasnella sp. 419]